MLICVIIVIVGEDLFITVVIEKTKEHIFFLDSSGNDAEEMVAGIKQYLRGIDRFTMFPKRCNQQKAKISICHAYINAKLMLWECQNGTAQMNFLASSIASLENCFKLASIKWLDRFEHNEVKYQCLMGLSAFFERYRVERILFV